MTDFRFSSLGTILSCAILAAMLVLGGCAQDTLTGPSPEKVESEEKVTRASHNVDPAESDGGSTDDPDGGHNTVND